MTNITDTLKNHDCPSCGITFAIPSKLEDNKRINGTTFYCPNGHEMHFTKNIQSRLEKITKERDYWMAEAQRLLTELDKLRNPFLHTKSQNLREKFHLKF